MRIPLRLLRVGQMHCVKLGSASVLVCRTAGGIYAVENQCTHMESPLYGGSIEGEAIRCPLHGLKFDLRTGEPFTLGRLDHLRTYAVSVEDDHVVVSEPARGGGCRSGTGDTS
jgi:3-phenylpropionate/trans-cinnamate dioxygenase ferredoxin component